jgi:tRNA A37 threonylcarbamoyltransferase TsaD
LVDNAAMIAWLGLLEHENGVRMGPEESRIKPRQRTDDVPATWVKA